MKTATHFERASINREVQKTAPSVTGEIRQVYKPQRGKVLLAAGLLGVLSAAFILAAPELGLATAIGGTLLAGISSAGVTLLARR